MTTIYSQWDELSEEQKTKAVENFQIEDFQVLVGSMDQETRDKFNETTEDEPALPSVFVDSTKPQTPSALTPLCFDFNDFFEPLRKRYLKFVVGNLTKEHLKRAGVHQVNTPVVFKDQAASIEPLFQENGEWDAEIKKEADICEVQRQQKIKDQEAWERKVIKEAIKVHSSNPNDTDKNLLASAANLLLEGTATGQIPSVNLDLYKGEISEAEAAQEGELFKAELIGWKTSKGFIYNSECRNPKTNRRLSGFLWLSEKGFFQYATALYYIYKKGCERAKKKCWSEAEWEKNMLENIRRKGY